MVFTECAIVRPEIEAGFLGFDARQQQTPAASGTMRAKPIDELIVGDVRHDPSDCREQEALLSPMTAEENDDRTDLHRFVFGKRPDGTRTFQGGKTS